MDVNNGYCVLSTLADHAAAGTSAAFSFQFERALNWLARSPAGFAVGIETDDDVAVRNGDRSVVLEQDKHSVSPETRLLGNRSRDLWNTLGIWVEAVHSGEVGPATRFLLVTNKRLGDCIATRIGNAHNKEDVDACVTMLEEAAKSPPEGVAEIMRAVLSGERRPALARVIENCEVLDAEYKPAGVELREETLSYLQLPESMQHAGSEIVHELLGWLHETVLQKWQSQIAGWITRDHFVNRLHSCIDQRRRRSLRERAENLLPISDELLGQERARMFVRQVILVSAEDGVIDEAIREFVRCGIEKLRLSQEGNVSDEDWVAFEASLENRWGKIRARVLRLSGDKPEEDIGYEIFSETTEGHRENLAGSATEQVYLTAGTYHRLADSLTIGWHPNYRKLLS